MEPPPLSAAARQPVYPSYTGLEKWADRFVHFVGLASAFAAVPWLLGRLVGSHAAVGQVIAVSIYGIGLLGMLGSSTIYNFASPGPWKAVFRRLDHSMIFVMIAGSYMPFAFCVLPPETGRPLAAAIGGLALVGIALKLACRGDRARIFLVLYLAMGWAFMTVAPSLLAHLSDEGTMLLLTGALVYSLGSFVHTSPHIPFHNAIWHAMVVTAASLHFLVIAHLFPITPSP